MGSLREEHRVGRDYLEAVTTLLRRVRAAHPTEGLYETGDLQWWWRRPRPTDEIPQLFWFDEQGRPAAAVVATDWSGEVALAPMCLPGSDPAWVALVIERGLAHAADCGFGALDLEIDEADEVLIDVLTSHGFALQTKAEDSSAASISVVESWLTAENLPAISELHEGYRAGTRLDTLDQPHHMIERNGEHVEARLRETSLYRPDLDIVILDNQHNVAANGLFWYDPVTSTGLVEPMATDEGHRQRGLARHVLTTGVNRLAEAGAERIKICFEPDNPPAKHLYLDAGFEPVKQTVVFARPATDDR